jgi:hypothetical protein
LALGALLFFLFSSREVKHVSLFFLVQVATIHTALHAVLIALTSLSALPDPFSSSFLRLLGATGQDLCQSGVALGTVLWTVWAEPIASRVVRDLQ